MADGIAINGRCINHHEWFLILGRCYCLFLADVLAMVGCSYFDTHCLLYGLGVITWHSQVCNCET